MKKVCPRCKEEKDHSEFRKGSKRKYGISTYCKPCARLYDKENWFKYKKKHYETRRKRTENIRRWFKEYKNNLQCNQCEEDHPGCLLFHHIENKEETVSNMVRASFSIERILEEIKKCDVLCANCHFKLHWEERNNSV